MTSVSVSRSVITVTDGGVDRAAVAAVTSVATGDDSSSGAAADEVGSADALGPILKWAGGKSKLLPRLRQLIPPPGSFVRYFEPFCGGAAVFFDLVNRDAGSPFQSFLNDVNVDLVSTYRAVAADVEYVIRALDDYRSWYVGQPDRGVAYYRMRDIWNSDLVDRALSQTTRAAMMLFLNRTCYNGLWRVNAGGEFNAPYGKHENPKLCYPGKLRAASAALSSTSLTSVDYAVAVSGASSGDFVYVDSPYDGTFNSYSAGKFGVDEQARLASVAADLVGRGVRVAISNSDTALVRVLYRDPIWTLHAVRGSRSISRDSNGRGGVGELVVTGGYVVE